MQNLKYFLGVLLLPVLFFSCNDPYENEDFSAYDDTPSAIWLSQQPEYSEWVKMLKRADVYNAMNRNHPFTSFAVENDAIAVYLKEKGYATVDDIPVEDVTYLVRHHVIPYYAYTFVQLNKKISSETAAGDFLKVDLGDGPYDKYIEGAKIVRRDIKVTNGYIHGLDKLLTPVMQTVWDILSDARYSIFRTALEECGVKGWLSVRDTVYENDLKAKDYKTVLAISDEVFNANGISSVEDIKANYPGSGTDKTSSFYNFMMYHIINKNLATTEMLNDIKGNAVKGANIATVAYEPSLISVTDGGDGVLFNAQSAAPVNCVAGKTDIVAQNGYVHEIDGLLPIAQPDVFRFDWEFTDYPELYGIPFYRTDATRVQTYEIGLKDIKNIECFTIPEGKAQLSYVSSNQFDYALHKDYFKADLGMIGEIKFTTPIIAAGRYNIYIEKPSYGPAGGRYLFKVDGVSNGNLYHFGNSNHQVNLGTFSFDANSTHRISFEIKEGVGPLTVDRIMFVPVI